MFTKLCITSLTWWAGSSRFLAVFWSEFREECVQGLVLVVVVVVVEVCLLLLTD